MQRRAAGVRGTESATLALTLIRVFIGMRTAREWFAKIAVQQIRGAKAVDENIERLPKVGESSRK